MEHENLRKSPAKKSPAGGRGWDDRFGIRSPNNVARRLNGVVSPTTGTSPAALVFHHRNTGLTGGAPVAPPKKYHTDEERREAARQYQRKYRKANRKTISAREAERRRKIRELSRASQTAGTAIRPQRTDE
jgi:hypothetical protein